MVAPFTMRTYGVNLTFRYVEGIWLHRKSRQMRERKKRKRPILHHTCATCSELPFNVSTMPTPILELLLYSLLHIQD